MDGSCEYDLRGPMPWGKPRHDERAFFQSLTALRGRCEALATGSFRTVFADDSGLFVYRRSLDGHTVTVALNAGIAPAIVFPHVPAEAPALSDGFTADHLAPLSYAVWA